MGAVVSLYNRYDELVRRGFSNQDGKFVFDSLAPNVYSIRVSLASFVPALRRNISVLAGSENLLKIQLASALSTIELVPLNSPGRRPDERFLEVGVALLPCNPAGSAAGSTDQFLAQLHGIPVFGDQRPGEGFGRRRRSVRRRLAGSGNRLRTGDLAERIFEGSRQRQCGLRGQRFSVGRFADHLPPR